MASQDTSDLVHTLDSVVRGQDTNCRGAVAAKARDESDPGAVAVLKHGVIVGHLP